MLLIVLQLSQLERNEAERRRLETTIDPYRIQEVAGSGLASSIHEAPANRKIWSRRAIAGTALIYFRATKLC